MSVSLLGCGKDYPYSDPPMVSAAGTGPIWAPPAACNRGVNLPTALDVKLDVYDYRVVRNIFGGRLAPITQLHLAGLYVYGNTVYAKIGVDFPGRCTDDERFYIVDLPNQPSGTYDRQAKLWDASLVLGGRSIDHIPDEIQIWIKIRGGVVESHKIDNPTEATIGLFVERVGNYRGRRVAVIRSRLEQLQNDRWLVILPQDDGEFSAIAKRSDLQSTAAVTHY